MARRDRGDRGRAPDSASAATPTTPAATPAADTVTPTATASAATRTEDTDTPGEKLGFWATVGAVAAGIAYYLKTESGRVTAGKAVDVGSKLVVWGWKELTRPRGAVSTAADALLPYAIRFRMRQLRGLARDRRVRRRIWTVGGFLRGLISPRPTWMGR